MSYIHKNTGSMGDEAQLPIFLHFHYLRQLFD